MLGPNKCYLSIMIGSKAELYYNKILDPDWT